MLGSALFFMQSKSNCIMQRFKHELELCDNVILRRHDIISFENHRCEKVILACDFLRLLWYNEKQERMRGDWMNNKTVVVGMSGGVDSSVAAAMLKEQGHNVVGVTMVLWQADDGCGSLAAVEDARRVAEVIGIRHEVLDFREVFCAQVVDAFAAAYIAGRTPNPCILCNRHVKWEALLAQARVLGAEYIATGHYARVCQHAETGRYTLMQSPGGKDQSYALYNLTQEHLAHTLMPLWEMPKDDVRAYAARLGLPVAHKPDSQEICFVPDKDYAAFVEKHTGTAGQEGCYVDRFGACLGRHKGILHYTIGQRKGLGVAFGRPMFVTDIRPAENEVVLGENQDLLRTTLTAGGLNFMALPPFEGERRAQGKIRYNQQPAPCTIRLRGDVLECTFDEPQRAVTPGQAAVFYWDGCVLCGGTILRG